MTLVKFIPSLLLVFLLLPIAIKFKKVVFICKDFHDEQSVSESFTFCWNQDDDNFQMTNKYPQSLQSSTLLQQDSSGEHIFQIHAEFMQLQNI